MRPSKRHRPESGSGAARRKEAEERFVRNNKAKE